MKEKLGLFDCDVVLPVTQADREAAIAKTAETVEKYAPKSLTWMCRKNNLIPVKKEEIKKVQIVYIGYSKDAMKAAEYAKVEFEKRGASVEICEDIKGAAHMKQIADNNDLIIYMNYIGPHLPYGGASFFQEKATQFLHVLSYGEDKSVCVGLGSPFTYYDWFCCAKNYVNAYAFDASSMRVFVRGLYGEVEFTGQCPYDPNPLAPRL